MRRRLNWRRGVAAARRVFSVRMRLVLLVIIAVTPLLYDRVRLLEAQRNDRLGIARLEALDLAQRSVGKQGERLSATRSLLQTVGHGVADLPRPSRECNRFLANVASDIPWTKAISVFTPEGKAICASDPQGIGIDVSNRPYFQQVVRDGDFAVSGFIQPRTVSHRTAMAAAYAWRTQGAAVEFVLIALVDPDWIGNIALESAKRSDALALLVDGNDVAVAANRQPDAWIGRDLSASGLLREMRAAGSGTITDARLDRVPRVWGFLPVGKSDAYMLVGLDERETIARTQHDVMVAYLQLALAVLLVLLGAWIFGEHTILRPIRVLARAAEHIGRGDLSVRTNRQVWAREFQPLTHSLDRMASRLASRQHSLQRETDRFRELAAIDGLTGLSNRRSFDADLEAAWEETIAAGEPIALLMIDVDHFKRYNDRYGHVDGDACLRTIGSVLASICHGGARAARYGGEEFALLLPNSDQAAAMLIGEAVRQTVKSLDLLHEEAPCRCVTVSIGLAAMRPQPGDRVERLVTAADSALYASKRTRDRVTAYVAPPLALAS